MRLKGDVGRRQGCRVVESSAVSCVCSGVPACLPADALAFDILLIVPAGLQEKMLAVGNGSVNVVGWFTQGVALVWCVCSICSEGCVSEMR